MYALIVCIATATVGIDVGWERAPEGGMEYIIQFDPQTVDALRGGKVIQSDIPPEAGDVRSFRIVMGTEKLRREPPPEPAKPWLPLTATLFGLFASLSANVYLCWIAWDSRQRLRTTQSAQQIV